MKKSVLILYTGGTIGMVSDPQTGSLMPFDFSHLRDSMPELDRLGIDLDCFAFEPPVDSSDTTPDHWRTIVEVIDEAYERFDGFVVLHGTDTMSYTASAVSFMLNKLAKPVVFTGSQLPIGVLRTDGKENLITAIQIAAMEKGGAPCVQEVSIYFGSALYRANRTHKYSAEDFNAFRSPNFPALAEAGIHLQFRHDLLLRERDGRASSHALAGRMQVLPKLEEQVAVLKLFPGIQESVVRSLCELEGLKGLVLETYGSGNGPRTPWFIKALQAARERGVQIVNVTQCNDGFVEQGRYATSESFRDMGIIPAGDMTSEAAITKLMHVLAYTREPLEVEKQMLSSLRGELTTYSTLV